MPKITVYTITDCPFCQQEKVYLNEHRLLFEEKNVETNRVYLSEMLAISDNFAGVPFTVIEKEDGSKVNVKGFTKEEFDAALGIPGGQPVTAVESPNMMPIPDIPAAPAPAPAQTGSMIEPTLPQAPPAEAKPLTSQPPMEETTTAPPVELPKIEPATMAASASTVSDAPPPPPTPTPPVSSAPPVGPTDTAPTTLAEPTAAPAPGEAPIQDPKLQEILSNLQKISGMSTEPAGASSSSVSVSATPGVVEPTASATSSSPPTIPDFPK